MRVSGCRRTRARNTGISEFNDSQEESCKNETETIVIATEGSVAVSGGGGQIGLAGGFEDRISLVILF